VNTRRFVVLRLSRLYPLHLATLLLVGLLQVV
jgi:peptidoglycan/LPS O-acetylase OafA/YrhL